MTDRLAFAPGLNAIADRYDGLILDQWGVLHNGTRPYDGVVEALENLRDRRVPVAILTNSSKGEEANRERMSRLGIAENLYGPLISTADLLKAHLLAQGPALPSVYLLASEVDAHLFDGTGIPLVDTVGEADCVVLLTIPDEVAEQPARAHWIAPAVALGLPLHTPSADVQSVVPGGGLVYGFHRTIEHYRHLCGTVHLHGKPMGACYDTCRSRLGMNGDQHLAAVGDQFDTDVIGAVRNGCTPIFVETGAAERDRGQMLQERWVELLNERCIQAEVPRMTVLPSLRW